MSFLPLLAPLVGAGLQAAQAPPSTATRQSSDYNPVISQNNVDTAGNLNSIASLLSTMNAGNSYNGGMADFGFNTQPIGGGVSISTGNGSGLSIGPIVLIGAALVLLLYLKKKS